MNTPTEVDTVGADPALLGAGEDQFVLQGPGDGQVTYGDSRTDIVNQLFDAHKEAATPEDRFQVRLEILVELANMVQAQVVGKLVEDGAELPDDEDFLTVLLHDRSEKTIAFEEWDVEGLPLFLIATGYAPYSEIPRPTGEEVVWLDPANETTFLTALESLGLVELLVKDPSLVPDPAE